MRSFQISVRDEEVKCDIPTMHVPPDIKENFAVYLEDDIVCKYKLDDLEFSDNEEAWLTQQRLNDTTIILRDNNKSESEPKFTVKLIPRGDNPEVDELDPRVVNEP